MVLAAILTFLVTLPSSGDSFMKVENLGLTEDTQSTVTRIEMKNIKCRLLRTIIIRVVEVNSGGAAPESRRFSFPVLLL